MGMSGRRAAALLVAFLLAAVPAVALGAAHLDRAFGENGVVEPEKQLQRFFSPDGWTVLGDGSSFFVDGDRNCGRTACRHRDLRVTKFGPEGRLAPGYGAAGTLAIPGRPLGSPLLSVDAQGRLRLAAEFKGGRITVRRYVEGGSLDTSFGRRGSVVIVCGCGLTALEATPDGGLLIIGHFEGAGEEDGGAWFLARLDENGHPVRRFGGDGRVRLPLGALYSPDDLLISNGAVLAVGTYCCEDEFPPRPYALRITPRGTLDTRYRSRAQRSINRLLRVEEGLNGYHEYFVLVPRPHGGFAAFGHDEGVAYALRGDGRVDRSFGGNGVRKTRLHVIDAVPSGPAGSLVVGYSQRSSMYEVRRLRRDGSRDPNFGSLALPEGRNEEGLWLANTPGGALVFDPDLGFCRAECPKIETKL